LKNHSGDDDDDIHSNDDCGRTRARGAWVVCAARMVSTTCIRIQIITNVSSRVQKY